MKERVMPGVTVLRPEKRAVFPYSNSVLIEGKDTRVLIDVGTDVRLLEEVAGTGVDMVLLSHFHFDHIHGYGFFPEAAFLAGEEELEVYRDPAAALRHQGYDRWDEIMGFPRPPYKEVSGDTSELQVKPGFHPIKISRPIRDGRPIELGGISIVPVKTPGHTSGHYAFLIPEREVMCSADIDCSRLGPWYGNPVSDVGEFMASIDRVLDLQWKTLATGHRRPLKGRAARDELIRFKNVLRQRNDKILGFLERPRTLNEIADQAFILKPDGSPYTVFWERVMARHHLVYLMQEGLVGEKDGSYFRR